jgi:hypothetical protein
LIHDAHLDANKAGPLEVAEYSVFLMHATVGRCYSVEEIALWLLEVGLEGVVRLPTAAYRSVIVATKRKDDD